MSTSEALFEGMQAGRLLLPAGLNKYPPGTPEHAELERGRLAASAEQLDHVAGAARMVA